MTTKSELQFVPGDFTATLTFTRGSENFVSRSIEVGEDASGERIIFRATMNVFSPFRIYFITFSVLKGLEKGTYELEGLDGAVRAYFSSSEYPGITYIAWRGSIKFESAPTLTDLKGTFEFEANDLDPQTPETATIKNGVFSLDHGITNRSAGALSVEAHINTIPVKGEVKETVSFKSTSIEMRYTIPDRFLEIVASDKVNDAYVYLHIPKEKLHETSLEIGTGEEGANALVHFRKGQYVEPGTKGTINFKFDQEGLKFIGNFSYADKYENSFKNGNVHIIR